MGANFLVVTCNTAHAFYGRVQPALDIPWIHMMRGVSGFITHQNLKSHQIGVMATTGTLKARLYSDSLVNAGLTPIIPSLTSDVQRQIMESIYAPGWGIKASGASVSTKALKTLQCVIDWFASQGADLVIAGCTELSVALAMLDSLALPWIDPLDIMADITVAAARGEIVLPSVAPKSVVSGAAAPESVVIYPARSSVASDSASSSDVPASLSP